MTTPDNTPFEPPTREDIEIAEQANDARLSALTAQYGVKFDSGTIMSIKFDTLLRFMLGDLDEPARRAFDATMVTRFAAEIDQAEIDVRKAVLSAGTPAAPSVGGGRIILPPGVSRR